MRTEVSIDDLLAETKKLPFFRDGAGIDMAYPSDYGFPTWLKKVPTIQLAIAEIEQLTGGSAVHLMLNRLKPGDYVHPHVDQMDVGERWHLVLSTNPDAKWWDEVENKEVHLEQGFWWGPVNYRAMHSVWNYGETERTHLVVDVMR